MTIGGTSALRGMPTGFDPQAMKTKMQQGVQQLKGSNPELAAKFEKVGARMEELKASGTDMKSAMQTIQKEFGAPSKAEMGELAGAMGIDLNQMGAMNMQNGDISAMLDQMKIGSGSSESNDSQLVDELMEMLENREDRSKDSGQIKQNIQSMIAKYTSGLSQGSQGSYFGSGGLAA